MLSVMLSVLMPSVIIVSVIMLSIFMMSVIMLSVIMLSGVAPHHYVNKFSNLFYKNSAVICLPSLSRHSYNQFYQTFEIIIKDKER
jgi:hypothetical protein